MTPEEKYDNSVLCVAHWIFEREVEDSLPWEKVETEEEYIEEVASRL